MHTTTFKINWDHLSRFFIGLLFVYSGVVKIQTFQPTTDFIKSILNTGSITPIITSLVIFVELVVGLLYIWGKFKKDAMAYILITFVALATIFVHSDFSNAANVIQALKNLAIIGGLLATLESVHDRRVLCRQNLK